MLVGILGSCIYGHVIEFHLSHTLSLCVVVNMLQYMAVVVGVVLLSLILKSVFCIHLT